MMRTHRHKQSLSSVEENFVPKISNLDTLSDVDSLPDGQFPAPKSTEKRKYVMIDSPEEHYRFSTTSQCKIKKKRRITMQEYQSNGSPSTSIQPYSKDAARHVEIMRRQYQLDAQSRN